MRRPLPHRVLPSLLRLPGHLYDLHAGWLLTSRFLRLTHTGRRSGRTYRTVLEVLGRDPATGTVWVLAGLGQRADWYRNVRAHPAVTVETGRRRFPAMAVTLGEADAVAVLAGYERRNRLLMPIIRRVLSRLTGWPYDSSDAARHRLVRDRPIVALRPKPAGQPAAS